MLTKKMFILAFSAICFACDDEGEPFQACAEYAEGDLAIGMSPELTLEKSFAIINDYGLYIDYIHGVCHESGISADSIDYVISYFNQRIT